MPSIHHELLIVASAEKVYSAITSQEGLSSWWTPGVNVKHEVDSIAHFPFGTDYFKEMKITELKPSKLVKWTCVAGADEWVGT
ncbi:MAG TPA: SRPBCC domain-containing protein, partial [Chryseolinea sp.]|nr:SRPBCC domain-containing protein [Chryseolinea sp.]